MSDISEGITIDGTADAAIVEGGETPEAAYTEQSYLDLDQYGNQMVSIKVNGEELTVPLAEAVSGYQRQQDYTRKTQELAEQRKRLATAEAVWDAIHRDPQAMIEALSQEFGVSIGTTTVSSDGYDDLDETPDVAPRAVTELERRLQQLELDRQAELLDRQVNSLKSKYGEFNENDLYTYAVQNKIQSIEAAYKAWKYDDLVAERKAREESALAAKRDASFIEGGATRTNVAPKATEGKRPTSIKEAFLAAKNAV